MPPDVVDVLEQTGDSVSVNPGVAEVAPVGAASRHGGNDGHTGPHRRRGSLDRAQDRQRSRNQIADRRRFRGARRKCRNTEQDHRGPTDDGQDDDHRQIECQNERQDEWKDEIEEKFDGERPRLHHPRIALLG